MALGLEDFILVPFLIQSLGFVFLLLGNFVYNEVLELKFLGLNKHLMKYQQAESEDKQDTMAGTGKLTDDPNEY